MDKTKTKSVSNEPLNGKETVAENKRLRLANALRDNLSKRKQQARGRASSEVSNLKNSEN
jgi:hypothetical protein